MTNKSYYTKLDQIKIMYVDTISQYKMSVFKTFSEKDIRADKSVTVNQRTVSFMNQYWNSLKIVYVTPPDSSLY